MEVDDGGRWNIIDNTYQRDTWLHITEYTIRHKETSLLVQPGLYIIYTIRESIYIYNNNTNLYDALIVRYIHVKILLLFILWERNRKNPCY